jgi:TatD DNase family protein
MLIDAHTHLDGYGGHASAALDEIRALDILTVSNSMDLASYKRALGIARQCDLVVPIFGIHPWNAPEHTDRLDELESAIRGSPMIGEIGLDHRFVEDSSLYPAQLKVFRSLLSAAVEQRKVVSLHTSGAEETVLRLLREHRAERVVVHWYSGPIDTFRALADRGAFFSFGIDVLHSKHVRRLATETPRDLLLTETDNPGGPEWLTGSPGRPALILDVVDALAEARRTTRDEIIEIVADNFLSLIHEDPWMSDVRERFF